MCPELRGSFPENLGLCCPEISRADSSAVCRNKAQGGGTILDFGVYVLQIALQVLGPVMPTEVRAVGHVNKTGCDEATAMVLKYPGNRTAMLGTSALADMNNDAYIWGTKGCIRVSAHIQTWPDWFEFRQNLFTLRLRL